MLTILLLIIFSGKVLVQTCVFKFNNLYRSPISCINDYVYFYFQISPPENRTKSFKLILDLSDVNGLLWNGINEDNCFEDFILYETVQRVAKAIVCYSTYTYRGLKLPMISQKNQMKYDLLNSFAEITTGADLLRHKQISTKEFQRRQRSSIVLPLLTQEQFDESQIIPKYLIDKIVLQLNQFPSEVSDILNNYTMLTPVFRGHKIIYKQTKKINNNYLIITVSYYHLLQIYQLNFYIPRTSRNFLCFIHPSDFQMMSPAFLESIFPYQTIIQKKVIDFLFEQPLKFSEICKNYNALLYNPNIFQEEQQNKDPQMIESQISIDDNWHKKDRLLLPSFVSSSNNFSEASNKRKERSLTNIKKSSHSISDYIQQNEPSYESDRHIFYNTLLQRRVNFDTISNFEIKIWELLISNLKLIQNQQGKFIVEIDTFKGVLREQLLNKIVHLGLGQNVNFEVYIENFLHPIRDIFESFQSIRLKESQYLNFFNRISFFENLTAHNDKIVLRQLLYNYFQEENFNLQNHTYRSQSFQEDYEFNLADIRRCALFVLNKIRKNYTKETEKEGGKLSELEFQNVDGFYSDKKCPQNRKVNIQKSTEAMLNAKFYQYILLHRGVFTIQPPQMVAIFYRPKKEKFYIFLWNTLNSKNTTLKLKITIIEKFIPYVKSMIELKLYLDIGKRILLQYKNNLLLKSYENKLKIKKLQPKLVVITRN